MVAELNSTVSQELRPESTDQVPRWGHITFHSKILIGAKRSRSKVPERGQNLCFPIPLQSTWRLQANDQDWAAGSEAKNSHGANRKELAGLVARETVAERATKQGESVRPAPREQRPWWEGGPQS